VRIALVPGQDVLDLNLNVDGNHERRSTGSSFDPGSLGDAT
jgi:hypothetical protein